MPHHCCGYQLASSGQISESSAVEENVGGLSFEKKEEVGNLCRESIDVKVIEYMLAQPHP